MTINLLTEDLDPETIPAKFKDPESGAIRVQAMVNSYSELEKKMAQTASGQIHSAPEKPEDYCIDCEHGMFESDADVNRIMHEAGMSQEQAQAVYNLAAERMIPMIKEIASDVSADREVEKLMEHFGGPEKWKEVSRQLLAFGQRNLPEDVLENLSSSYEGVKALYKMMKSEEPALQTQDASNPSLAGEQDLQSMMRDPKYWRDRDPAFVTKVTEGFKNMYGK